MPAHRVAFPPAAGRPPPPRQPPGEWARKQRTWRVGKDRALTKVNHFMPEIREQKVSNAEKANVSDRVAHRLQEVERRLHLIQNEFAQLLGRVGPAATNPPLQAGVRPDIPLTSPPPAFGAYVPGFGPSAMLPGPGPVFGAPPGSLGPLFGTPSPYAPPQASGVGVPPLLRRTTRELKNAPPQLREPLVNLIDEGDDFVVQCELPGVRKEDLEIVVYDHTLSLNAEARTEAEEEGALLVAERLPVQYRRIVPLPSDVNSEKGKASFKDGVLTLRIPKTEPTGRPRRLDVAYG